MLKGVHQSHWPQARQALVLIAGLLLVLAGVQLLPPRVADLIVLPVSLHVALETLAIIIAVLIFSVTWASRHQGLPRGMLVLACAFLGVAVLDFSHMMSYTGMPAYIGAPDYQQSLMFSLVARSLGALSLLAMAWLTWRDDPGGLRFPVVLSAVLIAVVIAHWLILCCPDRVPPLRDAQDGFTLYRAGYKYGLMLLYILAALGFWRHMSKPRRFDASGFFIAVCVMAQGEYFFTLYDQPGNLVMLVGHIYKVLAFAFLFRAVFIEMIERPYALLDRSRARQSAVLGALPDLVLEIDMQGRYRDIYTGRPIELSAPADQLLGRSFHEIMPQSQAGIVQQALDDARAFGLSRGRVIALEVQDGQKRWFELSVAYKTAGAALDEGFIVVSRDVTERRQSQQSLRKWGLAVEQSTAVILIMDADMRIEYVNQSFCRVSGYTPQDVLGRSPGFLASPRNAPTLKQEIREALARGAPWSGEILSRRKDGSEYTESMLIYPVLDESGEASHYLAIKEDITESKQSAERIHQLANYDQLTGLPNRSQLYRHFNYLIRHVDRMALLWIDLDHFKQINDALGHSTGDLLLMEMSLRLRASLGVQDVLSRLSGDDFVVLLPGEDHHGVAVRVEQLLVTLAQPMQLAMQTVSVSATVGVAMYPDDATQAETLLQRGEAAMYQAKEEGRGTYRFFQPEMQEHATRTLSLGNALKAALARNELYLEYQPQVALSGGRISGAEALLRWRSPDWGSVVPAEFIPIAEANGILPGIEEWVMLSALQQLRRWMDGGLTDLHIAVNISAAQFERPDLADQIEALMKQTGVPPGMLELELTEAIAMRNPQLAARQIGELSRRHIAVSIDDFGTGYSSLSSLKRFMINTIKIDQSFVRDINTDQDDQAITRAIIYMAQSLGMRTIAEGVETPDQLAMLARFGCDAIQGYHVSRSLLPDVFEDFVRRWNGIAVATGLAQASGRLQ
ncbi:MAG: EAL domain-containing protein [Castellaniella sp.]